MMREPLTRRAPPRLPLTPKGEAIWAALQRLTTHPDWPVFIEHFKAREWEQVWAAGPQEPGALLRREGRISLLRELEGLGKRVSDDGSGDQPR